MALDATSEEFIQLLRDARDSVSHAAATAADVLATAADVAEATNAMNTAVTKAAEALSSANSSEASHQASLALYTSLAAVQAEATNTQLRAWEAQAEKMTAESFSSEAEDVFVNTYTSNGDGTFTATPTTDYSALHWAAKANASAATNNLPILTSGDVGKIIVVNGTFDGYDLAGAPTSGTYVATMTGNINISVTNNPTCMYTRVGNVVTVSAKLYFETVAGDTQTRLSLTLPVASNFTSVVDCIGVGNWWPAGAAVKSDAGTIHADTTNNIAVFDCTAADSAVPYIQEYFVTFQYIVK